MIKKEQQQLADGKEVPAHHLDHHTYHVLLHNELLKEPKVKKNPAAIACILKHIEEHIRLLKKLYEDHNNT